MVESDKKSKKPKVLVWDIDDTVLGFLYTVCSLHNKKYGTCISERIITNWDFKGIDTIDARGNKVTGEDLYATFKYFEDHGLYAALRPLDYAKYALDTASEIGYKNILLTARDPKFQRQTEVNLLSENISYDEIYFEWDKVKKINELSKKYDVVLFADDKVDTVKAVFENCKVKHVFLVNQPHNQDAVIDEDIKRAHDLMDCLKELKRINK